MLENVHNILVASDQTLARCSPLIVSSTNIKLLESILTVTEKSFIYNLKQDHNLYPI